MKEQFKRVYFILLGMIIFGAITVSAAIMLQPNEVSFTSDKTSQNTVKGALDELYDISRGECPAGHICTICGAGSYANQTTMECVTCPSGYTSDVGAGKEEDCYIETTAGKYIANAGDSTQTNCPAGSYCLSTKIKYGSTGGDTICPNGYTSAAGATLESNCYIQTTAGKYIATAKSSTQTTCPANSYCPSAKVYYGNTGNIQSCGSGKTSPAGSSSYSQCQDSTYTYTKTGRARCIWDSSYEDYVTVTAQYTCDRRTGIATGECIDGVHFSPCGNTINTKEGCFESTSWSYSTSWGSGGPYSACSSGSITYYGSGMPQTESCS